LVLEGSHSTYDDGEVADRVSRGGIIAAIFKRCDGDEDVGCDEQTECQEGCDCRNPAEDLERTFEIGRCGWAFETIGLIFVVIVVLVVAQEGGAFRCHFELSERI
jgi:hypothetical protein